MYWYPTQARVAELTRELAQLEELAVVQSASVTEYISGVSQTLASAKRAPGFPQRQIGQWVWIASQLRIHGGTKAGPAVMAAQALNFLAKRLKRSPLSDADVQELNWVLESTIVKLGELLQPDALRSCLSAEELSLVEARLGSYLRAEKFDKERVRALVQKQLAALAALSTEGYLTTLAAKVDALFDACDRASVQASAAKAALLYLAEEHDVVDDAAGFLGLLDDVYVIEWAYAVVENNTRCLPLLHSMIEQWPFVADLAFVGIPLVPLDRYSQYVACACLHSLYVAAQPAMVVLRETGAYGVICAFLSSVQAAWSQAKILESEVNNWPLGQSITISDGTSRFKATYQGIIPVGVRQKYRLGVARSGSITVDLDVMPYISQSPKPHAQLSSGTEIAKWLKNRHLDPLVNLTGSGRRRSREQECILLLGPRHKLDNYLPCLKPFGSSVSAIVGTKYVTVDLRQQDMPGSATDRPYIYACSDADSALDLIREPPSHVSKWRVIVDGARLGRALFGGLSTADIRTNYTFCVLAELHEREASTDLIKDGLSAWYVEDQDVEAPPLTTRKSVPEDDAVRRVLRRHANHWAVTRVWHEIRNEFLEGVAESMRALASRPSNDQTYHGFNIALSMFLQKAISHPLRLKDDDKDVRDLAGAIASHARVLKQYDSDVGRLYELFNGFIANEFPPLNRNEAFTSIASNSRRSASVAVVCRSAQIASLCEAVTLEDSRLGGLEWMNIEQLRQSGSYDRVIVPGWLDRMTMRELANNGYGARFELLLFPFERKWFEATMAANHKWERRLETKTIDSLKRITAESAERRQRTLLWQKQTDARLELGPTLERPSDVEESRDIPEYEILEARAIESLHRSIMQSGGSQPTAKAQLVLFEKAGAYAYLPPTGRVIVLSFHEGRIEEAKLIGGGAERMPSFGPELPMNLRSCF